MLTIETIAAFMEPLAHYAQETPPGSIWTAIVREDGAEIRLLTWQELASLTEDDDSVQLSRVTAEAIPPGAEVVPGVAAARLCGDPACRRMHAHLMVMRRA